MIQPTETTERDHDGSRGGAFPATVCAALALGLLLLAGCDSAAVRFDVGKKEPIDLPQGLFPANQYIDKQNWATTIVIENFQYHPERLEGNLALTLKSIAYFEYLANDLRDSADVPPHTMRDLMGARDQLRELLKVPSDETSSNALNQMFSMSKLMAVYGPKPKKQDKEPEVAKRREVLNEVNGKMETLMNKIQALSVEGAEGAVAGAEK